MRKCILILIVGIVESGFKGPFLTQVSLFQTASCTPFTQIVFFAQMISSWICSMNYLHWNLVVHVRAPCNFFLFKDDDLFFFPGASACV